jgi:DNA-binding beta-propeller fold protein YncE
MKANYFSVAALCLLGVGVMQSETAQGLEQLYISGYGEGTLSTINSLGVESVVQSGFVTPEGLAFDSVGNLYLISDVSNRAQSPQTISKITPDGNTTTFASGIYDTRGALAFDKKDNLYVTTLTSVIKITPAGVATTFVSGLSDPRGLAFDKSGNLYGQF